MAKATKYSGRSPENDKRVAYSPCDFSFAGLFMILKALSSSSMAIFKERIGYLSDGKIVRLRSPFPSDAPLFPRFQKKVATETKNTFQIPSRISTIAETKKRWQEFEACPISVVIFAFHQNSIAGVIGLHRYPPHPWTKHLAWFGMMVEKRFWGTGVSDLLMQGLLDHARKKKIKKIEAHVRTYNKRGIRFYEKHGFVVEGKRRKAIRIKSQFYDEFFIAKFLERN